MPMPTFDWGSIGYDLLKVAAGALLLPSKTFIVAAWNRLMHDLPYIHGTYQSSYRFRLKGGEEIEASETIRVRKVGRWVWATAEMTKPITKRWRIKGEIRGSYLFATVESATRKTLSGRGSVVLHSIENGSELEGYMVWVDSQLKAIYATRYAWKRLDKEQQD